MRRSYYVKAIWDGEAGVWISETDIPGLVVEADRLSQFEQLTMQLAPEMLAENGDVHGTSVRLHFRVDEWRELEIA